MWPIGNERCDLKGDPIETEAVRFGEASLIVPLTQGAATTDFKSIYSVYMNKIMTLTFEVEE
jgi:hypothetical protein